MHAEQADVHDIPEHGSPARWGPDAVNYNWIHPGTHEQRVHDVSLKPRALSDGSRNNSTCCGCKLQMQQTFDHNPASQKCR